MKIVIFGLTITSSWGNGHATLWRGLCRSLAKRGHRITFFEKDVPYYKEHRDLTHIPGVDIVLYSRWSEIQNYAKKSLEGADTGIVTSYCADGIAASKLLLDSKVPIRAFYDLDTPVTLSSVNAGENPGYLPPWGLSDFDLVLSYTGGEALTLLQSQLGAKRVAPLYGSVDPEAHHPTVYRDPRFRTDLSYIGTYSKDRQDRLEKLFLEPARLRPDLKFTLAGSMYPADFPWRENIHFFNHLPPLEHSAFYSASRITLNITRQAMADLGYCPSGRLFEAAACGVPILSDDWKGMDLFFDPGREILIANSTRDATAALDRSNEELSKIARRARERTLEMHTSDQRAIELENILSQKSSAAADSRKPMRWGIVPAAGAGTRIQPLAFSKELLPVGSKMEEGVERPRTVSEFLMERMIKGGANRICFVLSPGKSDIFEYFCSNFGETHLAYVVQPKPVGLNDALFRSIPLIHPDDTVMVGLPDTIWFPEDGYLRLPTDRLSFLLFNVEHPERFDAVVTNDQNEVLEIQVKKPKPATTWVWGAFQMPGRIFHELHELWIERDRKDEYFGTLVNAYLAKGASAVGVKAGEIYVDVGTLPGYREATRLLQPSAP